MQQRKPSTNTTATPTNTAKKIRVLGYIDQVLEVPLSDWEKAEKRGSVAKLIEPMINALQIEVTFGPVEDF